MVLTVAYDGYGVVANGDAATNDTGGSATGDWKELGGGTIGENPDVFLFSGGTPQGSIGSKYASKSGYTYIDGITALDFDVAGAQEGEMIYMWVNIQSAGAFDTLANGGFNAMIGSATGASNEWKIAGSDDANGWSGGWKLFVIDPTITANTVVNGTRVLSAIDTIGIWLDTIVSVRADSVFQSQILCAKGLAVTGTSATGEGWNEIITWATDLPNRAAGMVQLRGATAYLLGGITIGDGTTTTVMSASGNNIECEESSYYNDTTWVSSMPTDVNFILTTVAASLDWENINISGFVDNKLGWDTSAGNASSVSGGSIKLLRAWTVKASDSFDGIVFTTNDAISLGATTYTSCSFILSAAVTQNGTTITSCAFAQAVGTALIVDNLTLVTDCTFTSVGTGYAIDLGVIGANTSVDWDNTDVGYAATDGVTTNETIRVDISSTFTLTVNVIGGTTPTFHKTGLGTLVVVVNPVAVAITVRDQTDNSLLEGAAVTLRAATTGGLPFEDVVTITRSGSVATVAHTAHGLSSGHKVEIENAVQNDYNRIKTITVTGVNEYTYTVNGTPTTPATGTILSTAIIIDGLSNGSGIISDTRTYTLDQEFTGGVKKGTAVPVYVAAPLADTISKTTGFSATVLMIPD